MMTNSTFVKWDKHKKRERGREGREIEYANGVQADLSWWCVVDDKMGVEAT